MPAAPPVPSVPEPSEDPLEEGQLRLDELVDEEGQPDSEEELEARLSKVRQEKWNICPAEAQRVGWF